MLKESKGCEICDTDEEKRQNKVESNEILAKAEESSVRSGTSNYTYRAREALAHKLLGPRPLWRPYLHRNRETRKHAKASRALEASGSRLTSRSAAPIDPRRHHCACLAYVTPRPSCATRFPSCLSSSIYN
ncbi:unnamed protein product [Pieris macdunnoughi]|uniref:Uncharacterized protein n=1 Tax=Pieris macdunnoughi TaxID=345717 RepID=A0A821QWQ0_9NEOP|nr:unnamed protein product [Pieris macdunnoughi]